MYLNKQGEIIKMTDLERFKQIDLSKKTINYLALSLSVEKSKLSDLFYKHKERVEEIDERRIKIDLLEAEIERRTK